MGQRQGKHWDKETVRALRQHLGMTQTKMAEELGTRQQTISEWEKGVYYPRGTSATLLSIIAERNGFEYRTKASPSKAHARNKGHGESSQDGSPG